MDPQLQKLASQIADAVEERLSGAFEERIKAQIDTFDQRVKTQFDQFEHRDELRIKAHIDSLDQRVQTHIDRFEHRAELRMTMHFENLESSGTAAAERYGAILRAIERELADLNKKVDIKFRDQDLILSNHNQRITKLEGQQ